MSRPSGRTAGGRRRATTPAAAYASRLGAGYAATPARLLLAGLAVLAVAAVVLVALLWPGRSALHAVQGRAQFAVPGTTYVHGRLDDLQGRVTLTDGSSRGTVVHVSVPRPDQHSSLAPGDSVTLARTPTGHGGATYSFFAVDRGAPLWLLVGLFVVVLVAIGRRRGVMALVGLAVAGAMLWWFVIPALLVGHHPALVALAGSAVILYVVLYTTHGTRPTTSAALAGTLAGVAITVLLAQWAVGAAHLDGVTGDAGGTLSGFDPGLRFPELLVAAIVIAGLGVLNDVTITQASAVYELRAATPAASRWEVFGAAMRIGRDHIASTVYTIVFAYAGTALLTLLVVQLYDQPLRLLVGTEDLADEVVRTLVSSLGLILAMPITTAIATLVADASGGGAHGGHAHHHH
jgi:uncharacterized membrane protein